MALEEDPSTPSGYKWSSPAWPPSRIDANTRVTVLVVVERQRPLSKVLPFMRKTFGL